MFRQSRSRSVRRKPIFTAVPRIRNMAGLFNIYKNLKMQEFFYSFLFFRKKRPHCIFSTGFAADFAIN